MENQDPRLLLSAILATHLTDNRLGAEHNLYKIEQAFAKYVMEPGDTLQYYHKRFRAYLSGVQEAYGRAQIECPETVYRDIQLALKCTMGLNSSYAAYKQYYEDGIKNWPETLSDAITEAAKYKPRATGSGNPSDMGRANAFTIRGRGKGRGRGRHSGRGRGADNRAGSSEEYSGMHSGTQSEYGTRKGECHTCGEQGHYSFECGAKDIQGGQKMGAGGAQLEPSSHGKVSVLHDNIHDSIDSMSVNVGVSTAHDRKKRRVTFDDTVTDDYVGIERGCAVVNTEYDGGNFVIFSAEVYDHCEGFSDQYVLLDTCESLFKSKNLFYFTELSPTPMIISGVNPKGKPLIITECGETDFGFVYYDPKCIANILSFGNVVNNSVSVVYNHRHDCYVVQVKHGGKCYRFSRDPISNIYLCDYLVL
jgi:hypothetical protein